MRYYRQESYPSYAKLRKNSIGILTNTISISSSSPLAKVQNKTAVVHVAVVLALAKEASHIAEFHLLYESWRFIQNFWPLSRQVSIDLIVFCEQPSCHQLPSACLPLSYKTNLDIIATCFYEILNPKIVEEWSDYLYMTSIAFILTEEYRRATIDYHWILRVNQDAVLSPGIEDLSDNGEWPKWWRDITSLYAAEIAINHIYSSTLGHQHESNALDHPSFSKDSVWNVWHIHCLHNDDYFSKFKHRDELQEFLKHSQEDRIKEIVNTSSRDMLLFEVLNEYEKMQTNDGIPNGKTTIRDYVRALAWRKAYSAVGAINLN
ncbi:unnamed protein product [Rotaria sp. Silwood1]|nr:unnamed protein product [Rotaria sp. Silwood1]CAF3382658.1 unnamed protein product [Rotaria sp. Silwood1]